MSFGALFVMKFSKLFQPRIEVSTLLDSSRFSPIGTVWQFFGCNQNQEPKYKDIVSVYIGQKPSHP